MDKETSQLTSESQGKFDNLYLALEALEAKLDIILQDEEEEEEEEDRVEESLGKDRAKDRMEIIEGDKTTRTSASYSHGNVGVKKDHERTWEDLIDR